MTTTAAPTPEPTTTIQTTAATTPHWHTVLPVDVDLTKPEATLVKMVNLLSHANHRQNIKVLVSSSYKISLNILKIESHFLRIHYN